MRDVFCAAPQPTAARDVFDLRSVFWRSRGCELWLWERRCEGVVVEEVLGEMLELRGVVAAEEGGSTGGR